MTSRREFLRNAALATASIGLSNALPSFAATSVKKNSIIGANDRIRIGVIGVNSRGSALATGFAKMPNCEVTYICDCDSEALERCRAQIKQLTGKLPKGEKDIRKMLQSDEFDAVVVATPDHWHAKAAIMAMQAGKHVYLEKPTSHNPEENDMLMRAAVKYGKVIQVGNQRRSWPNIIQAIQEINDGTIGRVHYAKSWYVNNRPSIGIGKVVPVPANLDWNLWQGPAPRTDFRDNIVHYNWHWFWRWGTGEALNNGTHFVDIMRWGLGVEYPTMVTSTGGRWRYHDDWETPDTQLITYQFGNQASGSWEGRSCNNSPVDGDAVGVAFYGAKGTLYLNGGNEYKIRDLEGNIVKDVKSNLTFEAGNLLNPSEQLDAFHFANWFDAIRKGEKLNSDIREACISTQLVQVGNIAQRVGHSISLNSMTGKPNSIAGVVDKDVAALWTREYEPGWGIEI